MKYITTIETFWVSKYLFINIYVISCSNLKVEAYKSCY